MKEYRAYIVGPDGRYLDRIDLVCEDDGEASRCASTLGNGQPVELWQEARMIAEFKPSPQEPDVVGEAPDIGRHRP